MPSAYLALRLNRSDNLPETLSSRIDTALPFDPDARLSKQSGRCFLWGYVKDESVWPVPICSDTGPSAAVITGYAVDDDNQLLGARAVADEPDLAAIWRRFHGEWSACRLSPDGITAISSDTGTEHLYMTENAEFVGISNRARLLWETMKAFGMRPDPDLPALSALLAMGYPLCTQATAVKGIHLVDSTSSVFVPKASGPAQVRPMDPYYFLPKKAAPSWDELAARLKSNAAWYPKIGKPMLAALTGGKDSRLVLAMLHAAGLADKVDFYISVVPEHADYLAARSIADRFHLRFKREERAIRKPLLTELRRHIALTEGAFDAFNLTGAVTYHSRVGIHGLFGELYRGRGSVYATPRDAAAAILSAWFDLAGVLRPEMVTSLRDRTFRWFQSEHDRGILPDRARDVFYARQFVPRWIGQARLGDGLTGLITNPLYHPSIQAAYGALPHADRVTERVHFELMLRLCPDLVPMPFANASWNPQMVRRSSQPQITVATTPIRHLRPLIGSGWQLPTLLSQWPQIRERLQAGLPQLDSIVRPLRVNALLDVAGVVFGADTSRAARLRVALRHPLLLARASSRKDAVARQILGLLTLCALCDELRADLPSAVKVG
jgi:hypothetical protein